MQALSTRKEETDAVPAAAPLPAPSAPMAAPVMAPKKDAVEVTASAPASQIAGAAPDNASRDARALFYANQAALVGNGFRSVTGQNDAAPRSERAAAG